jgi:hypothetical protein
MEQPFSFENSDVIFESSDVIASCYAGFLAYTDGP